MPLILNDYECQECGHVFEELADRDARIPCPVCNAPSKRLIAAPRIDPRLGLDPEGFPTMADKWARVRRQRAKIESSRDP